MHQPWLVVGSERNWRVSFEHNNIWGLKEFRELRSLWNMLREGDGLLFYVSKPIHGVVGFGYVVAKFRQTVPLWPEEMRRNEVIWPLRFEFDVEYCLPPSLWETHKYASHDLQMVSRMVFQCCPIGEADAARVALGLEPLRETAIPPEASQQGVTRCPATISHDEAKSFLVEIGRLQGYIADTEYNLNGMRLDVVWRRVQRSVPTFVFEVQIGGDIYHAMAKLKHAFDLWNSRIFLVGTPSDRGKFQELISGTFHEVADQMRFIEVASVQDLLVRKRSYKELEVALGVFGR